MQPDPDQSVLMTRYSRLLADTLPYLQALQHQTIVIVCEGAALQDSAQRSAIAQDIALLATTGVKPVLLHGSGLPSPISPREQLSLEEINQHFVQSINQHNVKALGLSGSDARCVTASQSIRAASVLGETVDCHLEPQIFELLLKHDLLPVLQASASGPSGAPLRVEVEQLGSRLAGALSAFSLIFLGEAEIFRELGEINNQNQLAQRLRQRTNPATLAVGRAALWALEQGIRSVHIIDAAEQHALIHALLSEDGRGLELCGHAARHWVTDSNRYFLGGQSVLKADYHAETRCVARF